MLVGGRHGDAAAGRAGEQALLDEERLVHVLDRLGLLADADRQRRQPDRAAAELLAERAEDRPVDLVEPAVVDAEHLQARRGPSSASIVPSPRTSAKSRTRRSSRLAMRGVPRERRAISHAPSASIVDAEDPGGAA